MKVKRKKRVEQEGARVRAKWIWRRSRWRRRRRRRKVWSTLGQGYSRVVSSSDNEEILFYESLKKYIGI